MKLTGLGKDILRKKIKEHCGRETYNKYSAASPARSTPALPAHLANTRAVSVDYSNWKQVLFKFEEIILPALEAEGTRGIAEAKRAHLPLSLCACLPASSEAASAACAVLFVSLRQIVRICSKRRSALTRQDCLRAKATCWRYCRTVEHLVDVDFFSARPINMYHCYLSVFLPYTIGTDESQGQVVPSECTTQQQEGKWSHLRALNHRGNRHGGRGWLLNAATDDQAHLVFQPEWGLSEDLTLSSGQSIISREERETPADGSEDDTNSVVPAWVQSAAKVQDWQEFRTLFLEPTECGGFVEGRDFWALPAPQPGAAQSVLFLTATSASRRPANLRHIAESHAQQLPPARSVMTRVQNEARLVIVPPAVGGASAHSGIAALSYRTVVTEHGVGAADDAGLTRPARESSANVGVEQLRRLVLAYREHSMNDLQHAVEPERTVASMIAGEGTQGTTYVAGSGLRCELWKWVESDGALPDDIVKPIFASVIGKYSWVSAPSNAAAAVPQQPAEQPLAAGWRRLCESRREVAACLRIAASPALLLAQGPTPLVNSSA